MTRWSDKEVVLWAKKYKHPKSRLLILEEQIGVSHSTLWWCFTHRLQRIDYDLFVIVGNKLKRRVNHDCT